MKITYPAAKRVSVWLGAFQSEVIFEQAIERDIKRSLSLSIELGRISEGSCLAQPVSVQKLLSPFSGSKTFIAEAVAKAEVQNIGPLNAAFVCYYVDCAEAPTKWGDWFFLGTFTGYG